eukprot:scaffold201415_cov30-Tisochrysis_lutea.AAC.3
MVRCYLPASGAVLSILAVRGVCPIPTWRVAIPLLTHSLKKGSSSRPPTAYRACLPLCLCVPVALRSCPCPPKLPLAPPLSLFKCFKASAQSTGAWPSLAGAGHGPSPSHLITYGCSLVK